MTGAAHVAEFYRVKAGKAYGEDRGGRLYCMYWDMYLFYARGGWV